MGGFFYYICITLVIPKQSNSDLIAPFYTDGVFLLVITYINGKIPTLCLLYCT